MMKTEEAVLKAMMKYHAHVISEYCNQHMYCTNCAFYQKAQKVCGIIKSNDKEKAPFTWNFLDINE